MRDGSTTAAPTPEALRAMMAMAAAAASAAAGDASAVEAATTTTAARYVRHTTSRSAHNRRQSISHLAPLLASEPLPKGAPLPSAADGARWRRIAAVAAEIASKWQHPPESTQYETDTLHHVRAILYMNKSLITQSFVSHVSGVSQGSLSHYVRGLFRGNQKNVEDRLSHFVRKFAAGDLDPFLEEARAGSRPLGRALVLDAAAATAAPATTPSNIPTPQSVMLPPPEVARPPVPPPPPPQLQPPPWARPPSAQRPPVPPAVPSPASGDTPPRLPPSAVAATADPAVVPKTLEFSPVLTERARRARQRQIAQKQKKRGRTPFTAQLEQMDEPTPVVAVERAFHALVAPNWTTDSTHAEPLLLPIELYLEQNGKTLHMFTQWDVNERSLSPEVVADRIRRARSLPKEFATPAAMQIRRALFEAGIICPPPPNAADAENRRLIRIEAELKEGDHVQVLRDEFEWDLGMGSVNSPELFAQYLCTDASIPQKHAQVVARAIREKLSCAHAIAYGDEDTRRAALEGLAPDDPLHKPLSSVASALVKGPEQDPTSRALEEMDISELFVVPLLDAVIVESESRKENRIRKEKEEAARIELEALRAAEAASAASRRAKLDAALMEVNEAAIELQKERGLDFRPYLAIQMGRGERPGNWTPAVFDRKRRRQTSFPMIQPSRIHKTHLEVGPRLSRRRRSARRGDASESRDKSQGDDGSKHTPSGRRRVKSEAGSVGNESIMEVTKAVHDDSGMKVRLILRIRPPKSKSGGSSKKRRRR